MNKKDNTQVTPVTQHIIGGVEMNMQDYAAYIQMLSCKPFLSKKEAADLFGLGVNYVGRLMNEPDCPFVVPNGAQRNRKIHRESFERYILEHNTQDEV